jgi:hypothetical protein
MRQQHQSVRKHMMAIGYDTDLTVSARSTEHLSSGEFARLADRRRAELEEAELLRAEAGADRERAGTEYETVKATVWAEAKEARAAIDQAAAQLMAQAEAEAEGIRSLARDESNAARADRQATASDRAAARLDAEGAQHVLEEARTALVQAESDDVPLEMSAWLDSPLGDGKTVRDAYRRFLRKLADDPAKKREVLATAKSAREARSARVRRDLERLDGLLPKPQPDRHAGRQR